jgi:hypothetical protein
MIQQGCKTNCTARNSDDFAGNDYKQLQIVEFLQFQPVLILIAETLTYGIYHPSLPPVSEGTYT